MGSDVLMLKDATHEHLFAAIIISICGSIFLYNLFCLIFHLRRVRKLREAGRLIMEGYAKRSKKGKKIKVNGKVLDSSMIMDQINANKRKIKKKEENSIEGKKRAAAAQIKEEKKLQKQNAAAMKKQEKLLAKQEQKNALAPDVILDQLYALEDQMEMEFQIFYADFDNRIHDDEVRKAVAEVMHTVRMSSKEVKQMKAAEKKRQAELKKMQKKADKKKQQNAVKNASADSNVSLFD